MYSGPLFFEINVPSMSKKAATATNATTISELPLYDERLSARR
jgi:hypothetical protein